MSSSSIKKADIPLRVRLQLSHAYFQYLADHNSLDILHLKGYAFGTDTYPEGRYSSDIDVLVQPSQVDALISVLLAQGWQILTHFETGSIFEHAMTVYHPRWGLADIHRFFPGLGKDPAVTFERLWAQKRQKQIANFTCTVPSLLDSRIIVLVHAGRSDSAEQPEVSYLRSRLSEEDWQQVEERVAELDAGMAVAAALKDLEQFKDEPSYLLWRSVSSPLPLYLQWLARLRLAVGLKAKMKTLYKILVVNRDHLAMELGHQPSTQELVKKFFTRFKFWGK